MRSCPNSRPSARQVVLGSGHDGGCGVRIGIIGAGNIGGTLARLLPAVGHEVVIANSRGPDTLPAELTALEGVSPGTVEEAARAGQVVIEAIPFGRHRELPAAALRGRILVTASNHYPGRDGELDLEGRADSELVAEHVEGADVVKAFNTIRAQHLATQGDPTLPRAARRVIPLAGDDPVAKDVVGALIEELGFTAVDTGNLHEGGHVQRPGSPIYDRDLRGADFDAALAEARAG